MSDNSANGELALCGTMIGLTTITVGLRFYARRLQQMPVKADDVMATLSLITYIGAAICIIMMTSHKFIGYTGIGKDNSSSSLDSKLEIAWDELGTASLAFTKLSAVFFYRRIFCTGTGRDGWFGIATIATIAVIVSWFITFEFLGPLQCGLHFAALWNGTYEQYCTHSVPYLMSLAISDFILDVWILVLPFPRILQLHANLSRKLSITGIFLLAFVGLAASIARMVVYTAASDQSPGSKYNNPEDPEYTETVAFFLAMLEMGISLVAVNLPSLWMLSTSIIPEKVAHGLRAVASLASLDSRSRRSTSPSDAGSIIKEQKFGSFTNSRRSDESVNYKSDIEAQRTNVSTDWEAMGIPEIPEKAIHVQTHLDQF